MRRPCRPTSGEEQHGCHRECDASHGADLTDVVRGTWWTVRGDRVSRSRTPISRVSVTRYAAVDATDAPIAWWAGMRTRSSTTVTASPIPVAAELSPGRPRAYR